MGQAVQCQNGRGADGLLKSGVSYNLVRLLNPESLDFIGFEACCM